MCHTNYISLYVYNKIDGISLEFLDQLAREPYTAVMSCELDLGVQGPALVFQCLGPDNIPIEVRAPKKS